jgi:hypothetical protein
VEAAAPNKDWRSTLERVAALYRKGEATKSLTEDLLWGYVLAKLHNEYPNVRWARLRPPSVEIYLFPTTETEAKIVLIQNNAGALQREIDFQLSAGGVWTKNAQQTINLQEIFDIKDDPAELARIFQLNDDNHQGWSNIWDMWMKNIILSGPATEQFMYVNDAGQPGWILKEHLGPGAAVPDRSGRMVMGSSIPEPDLFTQNVKTGSNYFLFYLLATGAFLLLILLTVKPLRKAVLSVFSGPETARETENGREELIIKPDTEGTSPRGPQLGPESLERLHELALEQCRIHLANQPATFELVAAALQIARQEYGAAVPHLLKEEEGNREKLLREYRFGLGVSEEQADRIKPWIEMGQLAEGVGTEIRKIAMPETIVKLVGQDAMPKGSGVDWIRKYPDVLTAYNLALDEAAKKGVGLEQRLEQLKAENARTMEEKNRELSEKWKRKIGDLEQKNEKHLARIEALSSDVFKAVEDASGLTSKVSHLEADLEHANGETKSAVGFAQELQDRIDRVEDVRKLSRHLRFWLQGYHYTLMEKTREIRPLAVLTAMIHLSLSQMCFSIAEGRSPLTKASAYNIFTLVQKFGGSASSSAGFTSVHPVLSIFLPQAEKTLQEFTKEHLGGNTVDEQVFKDFLNWLKADTGADLSPFFIDVADNQPEKLVHVNAG